jgi:O-antigen/teichoic acid export membrane protein
MLKVKDSEVGNTIGSSLPIKFIKNALSYGYSRVITIILQLVLVPFFLEYWGAELYAEWIVVAGLAILLGILDLGVAQASSSKATISAGSNDWGGVQVSIITAFLFTLSLVFILIVGIYIATLYVDWGRLLDLTLLDNLVASQILIIMSLYLSLQLIGGPIDGWFRAMDRTPLGAFLSANRRLADFFVTVVTLMLGGGVVELAYMMLLAQISMLMIMFITASRCSPFPIFGGSGPSWHEFKIILRPALAYSCFPVSQAIMLQGGVQVLNHMVEAKTLIAFTMARTLVRLIIQFGVVINNALKPEISRMFGRGDMVRVTMLSSVVTKVVLIWCMLLYLILSIYGNEVVDWWSRGAIIVNNEIMIIVGAHALINVFWFIPAATLMALNKHGFLAKNYLASSIVCLFLWIVFRKEIDPIYGASLLLAIPELAVLFTLIINKYYNSNNPEVIN